MGCTTAVPGSPWTGKPPCIQTQWGATIQTAKTVQFSGLNAISHLCVLVAFPLALHWGCGAERQSCPASHICPHQRLHSQIVLLATQDSSMEGNRVDGVSCHRSHSHSFFWPNLLPALCTRVTGSVDLISLLQLPGSVMEACGSCGGCSGPRSPCSPESAP